MTYLVIARKYREMRSAAQSALEPILCDGRSNIFFDNEIAATLAGGDATKTPFGWVAISRLTPEQLTALANYEQTMAAIQEQQSAEARLLKE